VGDPGDGRVVAYYDGFDEWGRLDAPAGRLELERALACLERHLPPASRVLDLGGGPGRYSIELARRGHSVLLSDVSERQLERARAEIRRAGVAVEGVVCMSATDLSPIDDGAFDAVLAAGPFYHLTEGTERARAAAEVARVLRDGGLAFVSFLPRLGALAGLLLRAAADPEQVDAATLERAARDGVFENPTPRGFQQGWFAEPEELVSLFRSADLEELDLVSLRGLAADREAALFDLRRSAPATAQAFERLHEATARDPAVVRLGGHALLVSRRAATRPRL
jgi:SAM-dependent methyltransferase